MHAGAARHPCVGPPLDCGSLLPFDIFAMKPFLRQQLERFPVRLQELDFFLAQREVVNDMARYRTITREHAEVSQVAGRYQRFQQRERDSRRRARCWTTPRWPRWRARRSPALDTELPALEDRAAGLLLPKDPDDARNTFLEIRAGTGGDESALFAGDLLRMYTRYASARAGAPRSSARARAKSAATRKW
jgi:peptide chain release factor 1